MTSRRQLGDNVAAYETGATDDQNTLKIHCSKLLVCG
jgi:hypothetical protein